MPLVHTAAMSYVRFVAEGSTASPSIGLAEVRFDGLTMSLVSTESYPAFSKEIGIIVKNLSEGKRDNRATTAESDEQLVPVPPADLPLPPPSPEDLASESPGAPTGNQVVVSAVKQERRENRWRILDESSGFLEKIFDTDGGFHSLRIFFNIFQYVLGIYIHNVSLHI